MKIDVTSSKIELESSLFNVELQDGRMAHCEQVISQPYADAGFSAGLVEGIEPDTLYLQMEKADKCWTMFFRPDELQALIWIASGALWSQMMKENSRDD